MCSRNQPDRPRSRHPSQARTNRVVDGGIGGKGEPSPIVPAQGDAFVGLSRLSRAEREQVVISHQPESIGDLTASAVSSVPPERVRRDIKIGVGDVGSLHTELLSSLRADELPIGRVVEHPANASLHSYV